MSEGGGGLLLNISFNVWGHATLQGIVFQLTPLILKLGLKVMHVMKK